MPRGDGTGPAGQGPMTGGAFGYCAGFATPGFANPVRGGLGRGMAYGRGGGGGLGLACRRGRGGRFVGGFAPPAISQTPVDEKSALQAQLAALESTLSNVKQRLSALED
jgi:hypothetical protein